MLDTYTVYAQAALTTATLTLDNPAAGQIGDQLTTTTPTTATLFQLRLSSSGTVNVDTLRVRFTTTGGVANADVSAGQLWADTNASGVYDGGDTQIGPNVTPVAGVLTFTTDFTPVPAGTTYFVRAAVANLIAGDTTVFSSGLADVDLVEATAGEAGSVSSAYHTQDQSSGSDVYYSIGTSSPDRSEDRLALDHGRQRHRDAERGADGQRGGGGPDHVHGGARLHRGRPEPDRLRRALHQRGSADRRAHGHLGNQHSPRVRLRRERRSPGRSPTSANGNLAGNDRRLTWVVYNDGPLNVSAVTQITGTRPTPPATSP